MVRINLQAAGITFDGQFITEIITNRQPDPIPFLHLPDPACSSVLRFWDEKEDKILY